MPKFNFKADINFEANDTESAIDQLCRHFDNMLTLYLAERPKARTPYWFDGKMTLEGDSDKIICEGK